MAVYESLMYEMSHDRKMQTNYISNVAIIHIFYSEVSIMLCRRHRKNQLTLEYQHSKHVNLTPLDAIYRRAQSKALHLSFPIPMNNRTRDCCS